MSRPLAATLVAMLIPFLLLATWARLATPGAWELELLLALQVPDSGPLPVLADTLNTVGSLAPWAVVVSIFSMVALALRRPRAAVLITLSLASDLVAGLVKLVVERGRPEGAVVDVLFATDSFSFPSGHVVRATALVAVLAWLLAPPRFRLPLAVGLATAAGLVMGYARVALGVHWPTDVLGGLFLGLAWFALTCWLVTERSIGASRDAV